MDQEKVIYGFNSFSKGQVYKYEKGWARLFLPGYEKAKKVFIAGSFNSWDPKLTAMQFVDSGWMIRLPLEPGKYFYKYIVDGRWMADPNNRFSENDGQGNLNSVLYCPNQRFVLDGHKNARKVLLSGTFNNWNRSEIRMHRVSTGWALSMYLKEGTYSYKFLVDDEWMPDPANKNIITDIQGNQNSVIAWGVDHLFFLKGYHTAKQVVLSGSFNNWNTGELLMKKNSRRLGTTL
ncbi:MAG: hypothetical protein HC905_24230 [Bacteroidales bacterium]|nr:hypothetical protein [Bacteroidales bacterium]